MTNTKKAGAPKGNTNASKSGDKLDQQYLIYCTKAQKAIWPRDKNIAREMLDKEFGSK